MELHAPAHLPALLTPMPADKILFPRRMLYVEAVLYVLIAGASFGLGYLTARSGSSKAAGHDGGDSAAETRVPLVGTVMLEEKSGKKQPGVGAVVIVLPADKSLKPLTAARFRPGAPPAGSDEPAMHEIAAFGGGMARVDGDGHFQIFVPRPGSYRVLILAPHGTRDTLGPYEKSDQRELGNYFDDPAELLQKRPYKWKSMEMRPGTKPIDEEFQE